MTESFFDRSDMQRAGVALWRQIADALRLDITAGRFEAGAQLPPESVLAVRFGVNRHTVRNALAALQRDGLVEARQGLGTFVRDARRLSYRISRRTRFAQGLAGQAGQVDRQFLGSRLEPATPGLAEALRIEPGAMLVRIETLSGADGKPLSRATGWFPEVRFPGIDQRYRDLGSVTEALKAYGVMDYVRLGTRISARHADAGEAQALKLAPGAIVLVSEGIDADPDGTPIHLTLSRFAAERVDLTVGEGM